MNDYPSAPQEPRDMPAADVADRLAAALDTGSSSEVAATGEVSQLARLAGALVALPGLPPERRRVMDRAVLPWRTDEPTDDAGTSRPTARHRAGRLGGLALGMTLLLLAGRGVLERVRDDGAVSATPQHAAIPVQATRVARATLPPTAGLPLHMAPTPTTPEVGREPNAWPTASALPRPGAVTAEPATPRPSPVSPMSSAPDSSSRAERGPSGHAPKPGEGPAVCASAGGSGGGIAVRVLRSGAPVADADVSAGRVPDGSLDALAVTDAAGCARIGLSPGTYHVRVAHAGVERWHRDAADRSGALAVPVGNALVPLTVTLHTESISPTVTASAGLLTPTSEPSGSPTMPGSAVTSTPPPTATIAAAHAAQVETGILPWGDAPAASAPNPPDQTGGAVTDVAFDPRRGVAWTVIGPRVITWRFAGGNLTTVGASSLLPDVPEAIALDGETVAVGVPGNGAPAAVWLFDARSPVRPVPRAIVSLSGSQATVIGALAVGDGLAWALTDVGISLIDLKPAVPSENGWLDGDEVVRGRLAAPDALAWQGGLALLEGRRTAIVARPWGLALVDGSDPMGPRIRSSPGGALDRPAWPAFGVATNSQQAALVDVESPGPGVLTVLDVGNPSAPRVVLRRDLAGLDGFGGASQRDDPVHGRSRGPAVAWAGDDLVVLSASARAWAVARLTGPSSLDWIGTGRMATWDTSRARLVTVDDAAGHDGLPSFVAAAGDAGLFGRSHDGALVTASTVAPPLWQSSASEDGRRLFGAAGQAGLAVVDLSGRRTVGARGVQLSAQGVACGAVLSVAAASFGVAVITEICGLLAVEVGSEDVRVLGRLPWSSPQPKRAGAGHVSLAVLEDLIAWVEHGADGMARVAVADARAPWNLKRLGGFRPRTGDPVAIALLPDRWLVVGIDPLGSATLEAWPPRLGAVGPSAILPLRDAFRAIALAPGGVTLSDGLSPEGGMVFVGLEHGATRVIAQRAAWGRGAVAAFATTFVAGPRVFASDGAQLSAFDPGRALAPIGGPVLLPHGVLSVQPHASPWRDDVHAVGSDLVVALGDAGIMRFADVVPAVDAQRPAQAPARWVAHLPQAASWPAIAPAPVGVLLLDGSREGAAWLREEGEGAAIAAAADAWAKAAGHGFRMAFARWDDWARRESPYVFDAMGRDAAGKALATSIVRDPGATRRPDAALALAAEILAAAPAGSRPRRVLIAAAGSPEEGRLAGADARARALVDQGVELVVVALVGPGEVVDPMWSQLASAAGVPLRVAVNARELARWAGATPSAR